MKFVKESLDKGDCKELTDSRQYLSKHWNKDDFIISKAAPILNFYQQWGLLNRKDFLPLWVFEGAFGIRVVEMTIQLSSYITKGRTDNDNSLIQNIYYAEKFENLAKRIYKKYPDQMEASKLNEVYQDQLFLVKPSKGRLKDLIHTLWV